MTDKERDAIAAQIKNLAWVERRLSDGIVLRDHKGLAKQVSMTAARLLDEGEVFVREGQVGMSAFFIVAGEVEVLVRGQRVATRGPGELIGEMALLDIAGKRTASLRGTKATAVIELQNEELERLFGSEAEAWRGVARQLALRLAARTAHIPQANERPRMFIGSSAERLQVVDDLTETLSHAADVHPWTTIFPASTYTMPSLLAEAQRCDFAAFVFAPDDTTSMRGASKVSVRDNVVLEAGLFAGVFGDVERVFVLTPRGSNVHILSDLHGLNVVEYQDSPTLNVASAAASIRKSIGRLGVKPLVRS